MAVFREVSRIKKLVGRDALWVFLDVESLVIGSLGVHGARRIFYCIDYMPNMHGLAGLLRTHVEQWCARRLDLMIAPESSKLDPFLASCAPTAIGRNAPTLSEADQISRRRRDRDSLRQIYGIPHDSILLLHAGGVADDFGVQQEAEAAQVLGEDFVLILMGQDRRSGSRTAGKNILSLGVVTPDDWLAWLGAADIGLAFHTPTISAMPELTKWNTPLAWCRLYWYMAAGIPIVTGGHPLLKQILDETDAGVWVEDLSAHGIQEAVRQTIRDYRNLSAQATRAFQTRFNHDAEMTAIETLLEPLLAS